MADILTEPDRIRDYLKDNMAEGYLSDDESVHIDKFVDRYEEMMNREKEYEQIFRREYRMRVE